MKIKKCMVCGEKCEGDLITRDVNILEPVVCCETCFDLWTNQEYDKLKKRVKGNHQRGGR